MTRPWPRSSRKTVVLEAPTVRLRAYRVRGERFAGASSHAAGWHAVLFLRSGAFQIRAASGPAALDPNTALVLNRGDEYELRAPSPFDDRVTELELHPDIIGAMTVPPRGGAEPCLPMGAARVANELFRRHLSLWRRSTTRAIDGLAFEEEALDIAATALGASVAPAVPGSSGERPGPATRRQWRRLAQATQQYLATHFRDRLTLAVIADAVAASPHHLCRVFRAHTGTSIHAYRTELRLRAGLAELAEGRRDLSALALDLGYTSHAHFTCVFRRRFGFVPSEAQRRLV